MIALTAFTVVFSPAQAVPGGCSVAAGRYHDTSGSASLAASVMIWLSGLMCLFQYGFDCSHGGESPGAHRIESIAAMPEWIQCDVCP